MDLSKAQRRKVAWLLTVFLGVGLMGMILFPFPSFIGIVIAVVYVAIAIFWASTKYLSFKEPSDDFFVRALGVIGLMLAPVGICVEMFSVVWLLSVMSYIVMLGAVWYAALR